MGDGNSEKWPGYTTEAHPEIFNAIPPLLPVKKPGQFTDDQVKQFFREGYVLVPNFFAADELEPVKSSIADLVEELAQKLYKGGKITNLYNEYGLFQRLSMLERDFPGANIVLHKLGRLPQSFRDLWSNERLLNVAEQLLGSSDIVGHPVWNLRTKTPNNEPTNVPWHQDVGYLDNSSYKVLQITAWIPLLDSNRQNGCMELVREGHKTGRVAMHQCCTGNTHYVMLTEQEIEKTLEVSVNENTVLCDVPYRGALFFNNIVPHRSLNNLSNDIRWSLDLRWQRADQPIGFYGLKHGVLMRSSAQPEFRVDWDAFDAINRYDVSSKSFGLREDEFDTTIPGPWMSKWEIVHTNKHTEALGNSASLTSWHNTGMITG